MEDVSLECEMTEHDEVIGIPGFEFTMPSFSLSEIKGSTKTSDEFASRGNEEKIESLRNQRAERWKQNEGTVAMQSIGCLGPTEIH